MIRRIALWLLIAAFTTTAAAQTASTDRPISEVMGLLADNTVGGISPEDMRDAIDSVDSTGWGQWADTQYPCSGTPLSVSADTDTVLPNNGGSALTTYMPDDVPTFYDGSVITGRTGDGLLITVDMVSTPTSAATTYVEVWFDIGGAVGELYRRIISFPKGNGVVRPINFTVAGYTLDTWEANGATVFIRANGTVEVCDVRYIITRTHRGASDN